MLVCTVSRVIHRQGHGGLPVSPFSAPVVRDRLYPHTLGHWTREGRNPLSASIPRKYTIWTSEKPCRGATIARWSARRPTKRAWQTLDEVSACQRATSWRTIKLFHAERTRYRRTRSHPARPKLSALICEYVSGRRQSAIAATMLAARATDDSW
jgi:hypothetical protein